MANNFDYDNGFLDALNIMLDHLKITRSIKEATEAIKYIRNNYQESVTGGYDEQKKS